MWYAKLKMRTYLMRLAFTPRIYSQRETMKRLLSISVKLRGHSNRYSLNFCKSTPTRLGMAWKSI